MNSFTQTGEDSWTEATTNQGMLGLTRRTNLLGKEVSRKPAEGNTLLITCFQPNANNFEHI